MFEWTRKAIAHRRELREIAALEDRDLMDIGLGRDQLAHLVEVDPAVYDRMDRMAALHGLTHHDLQDSRPDFAALVHICEDCAAKDRYENALGKADTRAADTQFCPNHAAYRGMAKG